MRRPMIRRAWLAALVSCLWLPALAGSPAPEALPRLDPAWSLRLDGEVEWQRVAPLGQLLVKTSRALTAIDPGRGKVLWTRADLGGLAQDHYEEIEGTS